MVMMMVVMFMFVFMFMFMLVFVLMFIIVDMFFDFVDPCRGACHVIKIEFMGIDNFVDRNIAVVALDNFRLWLYVFDDVFYESEFVFRNLAFLI